LRVLAWDTETRDGYVACLVNSDGQFVETADTRTLLDFLFDAGQDADYNVFWNIRFDFGAIIKSWVVANGGRLKENHRRAIKARQEIALLSAKVTVEGGTASAEDAARGLALVEELEGLESVEHFDLGDYRLMYIPKKGFRLTKAGPAHRKKAVHFFDAMGWYSTGISEAAQLERAAAEHLNAHKSAEDEGIDVGKINSDPTYYDERRDAIACTRLETARTLFQLDRTAALRVASLAKRAHPKHRLPALPCFPRAYRSVYELAGFHMAELLAAAARPLRNRAASQS